MTSPKSSPLVLYDVSEKIATISLNRPDAANAQNSELLDELDACWTRATDDPEVAVIVLRANGKHFLSRRRSWRSESRGDRRPNPY
jgi:enoyl-CoA hydratase/carnithine racemase